MGIYLGYETPDSAPIPTPRPGGLASLGGMPQQQPSFLQSDNFGNILQALGISLMGSPRNAPLQNFGDALYGAQRMSMARQEQRDAAQSNNATRKWLVDNGVSETEADAAIGNPSILSALIKRMQGGEREALMNTGEGIYDPNSGEWIMPPNVGRSDYDQRAQIAGQYGLQPDDPRYQSFVLTGKMPREDQAPLTATDKKAILEADEMVAANENAIIALDQAEKLSDEANSGWFAGARASIGNNLPDLAVPDVVSSPDSSAKTIDFDNAVIGQALTSLKTIFGGNPTEGERKILLDLQGSSSMPKAVRKQILQRAKELATRRLEFNRERAAQMRGGDYYKPQGATAPASGEAAPADPLGIR